MLKMLARKLLFINGVWKNHFTLLPLIERPASAGRSSLFSERLIGIGTISRFPFPAAALFLC